MTIHITNIHGLDRTSTAQKAQNQVAQIACRELGFREIGMYFYDSSNEPQTALQSRFDGMIASLADNDTDFSIPKLEFNRMGPGIDESDFPLCRSEKDCFY